jgi:phage protein U
MDAMMTLGPYIFGLNTAAFQELNRNTEWRWGSQDVFEGVPAMQFTGWGKDTITLPGVIFTEYWGGTGQLDALRGLGDEGEPQTLIDGRGFVWGEYVITGVQERQSYFAAAGVPLRQEFTVTLERYAMGDETPLAVGGLAGAQMAADAAATASSTAAGIAAEAGSLGMLSLSALTEAAAGIQGLVASVATPLAGALAAVDQAMGAARSLQSAALDTKNATAALGKITDLASAQSAVGGMLRATSNATLTTAGASRNLQGTVGAMVAAGESANAVATVRGAMVTANQLAVNSTRIRSQAEDFIRGFL